MNKAHYHTHALAIILIFIFSAFSVLFTYSLNIVNSGVAFSIEVVLDICGMLLSGILYINCCYDPEAEQTGAILFRKMLLITFCSFSFGLSSTALFLLRPRYIPLNVLLTYCAYLCTLVFFVHLWYYFIHLTGLTSADIRIAHILFRILSIVQLLFFLLNPFTHILFYFDDAGSYHNLPTIWLCYIYYYVIDLLCLYLLFRSNMNRLIKHRISCVFLIPVFVDSFGLFIAQLDCLIFFSRMMQLILIYCSVYIERGSRLQKQRNELTESQLRSMLLQINPHFIYNTLGSVSSLCYSDPMAAAELADNFSLYLRNNFNDMISENVIHFEKELEHLKRYLAIEQVRFPEVHIVYDLQITDFQLPSLSIQPLVENAIRHGIHGRLDCDGTVTIRTWETDTAYLIEIQDDGVGFVDAPPAHPEHRPHIGIANVRKRLELLFRGTLEISSIPGIGTTCTITIPKGGKR